MLTSKLYVRERSTLQNISLNCHYSVVYGVRNFFLKSELNLPYMKQASLRHLYLYSHEFIDQLTGTVENTDCISAEG